MSSLVLASSLKCTSSKAGEEVTGSLNKFFNNLSEGLGDAFELVDLVDDTVGDIADAMSGITEAMSTLLEDKIINFIDTGLMAAKNFIFNKITDPITAFFENSAFLNSASGPIKGVTGAFGCLGSTIKKALKKTIKNMLMNMVNNGFINPLECAVNDFIGGLTNKIASVMDGVIGPLMAPINNLLGKVSDGFGSVKGFLLGGINIVSKIQGLINCADNTNAAECHVVEEYTLNGVKPKPGQSDGEKQNKFTKGLNNIKTGIEGFGENVDNLTEDIGYWGIFGGKRVTKESEIARIDGELNDINSQITTLSEQKDERTNRFNSLNSQLLRARERYPDSDFSELEDSVGAVADEIESLDIDITDLDSKKEILDADRLDTQTNVKDGAIIEEKSNFVGADLEREDPDCNTGNIFKCGKPKVSIFGGGGQGAVGDVILGNFIEALDETISETRYIKEKVYKERVTKTEISNSNRSVFENLSDTQINRILGAGIGDTLEGVTVTPEIRLQLNQFQLENTPDVLDPVKTQYQEIGGSLVNDIKTTGSIIGVDITYPGEGYTSEPIVRFEDNCEQGYGAFGKALIDKDPNSPTFGQLISILVYSVGENYPADTPEDAFVDHIEIEDGGTGYKLDDKVGDFEICGVDEIGRITKVCTNDKAYRTLPDASVESTTGSGAILTPIMTRQRRQTGVVTVIDCITPRGNIVGYVNGKEYNGPFHVHPETGQKMVGIAHTTRSHATIYNTPQESLRSGKAPTSNVGSTKIKTRSIQELITESETTQTTPTETYTDPVDDADDTPPSTPPSSTPPSSGGGGYGGGY